MLNGCHSGLTNKRDPVTSYTVPAVPVCEVGQDTHGYLDMYWSDREHTHVFLTLHTHYPTTDDNMICVIAPGTRWFMEPEEKPV